uniref:BED-type domain-containing protein n=1 Tax=Ditylenchus dipsaci TaxID=166011 RepID=A0A915DGM7_9BILA
MVKPKHWCWQFFAKGKETAKAICKFCSASNRGHAGEMAHHLTNQCKKIGPKARKTIENLAGSRRRRKSPQQATFPNVVALHSHPIKPHRNLSPAISIKSQRRSKPNSTFGQFGRTDITYLMDMLEPSDRGRNLTQEEVQAAMNLLSNKVTKNPAFIARENEIMIELAQWRSRTGIFAEGQRKFAWDALRATPPVDGLTFWTGFYSDSVLSIVYKALQLVQITAPQLKGIGRSGLLSTPKLHVEMVSKLTFIKHNLLLEHKDLFKKPSSQEKLEEEFEENANQESELFDDLVFEELVFDE